jgi:hypothetical protein
MRASHRRLAEASVRRNRRRTVKTQPTPNLANAKGIAARTISLLQTAYRMEIETVAKRRW